jgi:hypothetical protein
MTSSTCGDCIMKDGKAYIKLTLKPERFSRSTSTPLDLSTAKLRLKPDPLGCTGNSDRIRNNSGGSLKGCINLETTFKAPIGEETLKPLPFYFDEEVAGFAGRIYVGLSLEDRAKYAAEMKQYYVGMLSTVLDFIPVLGSLKAFFESIKKCYDDTSNSKPCDVLAVVFSGVIVMADIATIGIAARVVIGLKAFQKTYLLAVRIEQALEAVSAAGKVIGNKASAVKTYFKNLGTRAVKSTSNYFEGVLDVMKNKLSNYWDDLPECGQKCMDNAEHGMTKESEVFTRNVDDVGDEITEGFEKAKAAGQSKQCILKVVQSFIISSATDLAQLAVVGAADWSMHWIFQNFFGVRIGEANNEPPAQRNRAGIRVQAATATGGTGGSCSYDKAKANVLDEKFNGANSAEFKQSKAIDYDADPSKVKKHPLTNEDLPKPKNNLSLGDIKLLTPHHIIPWDLTNDGKCGIPKGREKIDDLYDEALITNTCNELRQMLSNTGIDVTYHPCNIVLLPDDRVKQDDDAAKNKAIKQRLAAAFTDAIDHGAMHRKYYYYPRLYNRIYAVYHGGQFLNRQLSPVKETPLSIIGIEGIQKGLLAKGIDITNGIKNLPKQEEKMVAMCAFLQLTAAQMLFGSETTPVVKINKSLFVGIPTFASKNP